VSRRLGLRIKGLVRQTVSFASFLSGYCFVAERLGKDRGARILCYHGVHRNPSSVYAVSTEDFRQHMAFLAEHFCVISMAELVALLQSDGPMPRHTVAITIDDGFKDAYTDAYPILRELGLPATFFLPLACIDGTPDKRTVPDLPQSEFLSWDEIREMSCNAITFGSHTLTHAWLTQVGPKEVRRQIERSKAELEDRLGMPIAGFSYPYGNFRSFNAEIKSAVKNAGYGWAVTVLSGTNRPGTDMYALRRVMLARGDSIGEFKRVMHGALDPWIVLQSFGRFLPRTSHSL